MLGSLGWQELLLILAIVGLLAGGSRVADLGGSLGRGVREFREGLQDEQPAGDPVPDSPDAASEETEEDAVGSSSSSPSADDSHVTDAP